MHPIDSLYNEIIASPAWMADASCRGHDPFMEDITELCMSCPVLNDCQSWADGENLFSVIAGRQPGDNNGSK